MFEPTQTTLMKDLILSPAGLVDLDASLFFELGLFLLLMVLLNKRLAQPMLEMFDKRHELTGGARDAAKEAVEKAESRIAKYEEKVGAARKQALAETKRIRTEGSVQERELLEAVRAEVGQEVDKGLSDLQSAAAAADTDLQKSATELGERFAARVLGGAA